MERFIQISAGRGPQECNLAVQQSLKVFKKEADQYQVNIVILEQEKVNGALCSVTLKVEGKNNSLFLSKWIGTIQWICKSPIRPQHKRKNWFIGIFEIKKNKNIQLDINKIKFETMRSMGPGGQHVNKVNSAVRATYLPTGAMVQVMDTRSQLENKQIAIERLREKIDEATRNIQSEIDTKNWINQLEIKRGNPIRTFIGLNFLEK